MLENSHLFFALQDQEREVLNELGREESYLAVPKCYEQKVRDLKTQMKGKSYEKRRQLFAEMKQYLIPVNKSFLDSWDEELGWYVVGTAEDNLVYDEELGLFKTKPVS